MDEFNSEAILEDIIEMRYAYCDCDDCQVEEED